MLYVITRKASQELDMPVFDLDGQDCTVVFSSEPIADFYLKDEAEADQLAIAEVQGEEVIKLLQAFQAAGVECLAINPRPQAGCNGVTPATVKVSDLMRQDVEDIGVILQGMQPFRSGDTDELEENDKSSVVCFRCGREEFLSPNETLPYCCAQVMRPAALQATSILAGNESQG